MIRIIIISFLLLQCHVINAQNFERILSSYAAANPVEKIYIHYDKEYYSAGETIWFKAYVMLNNRPSTLSSNFFLQVFDLKGNVIDKKTYAIAGGSVKGSIDLHDSLKSGTYIIRAATSQMLNDHGNIIYNKNITVLGRATGLPNESKKPVSVNFFPESGNLVNGILTVVAFKAIGQDGKPIDISGMVQSPDGMNIPFKSYHDGIGKFQIRPKAGVSYTAEIKLNGQVFTFPLPSVQESGVNLRIENEKGGKLFQIARSEKDKEKYDQLTLIAELNNSIVYNNTVSFDGYPSLKGHLLTDSLPSGILHFTVFNDKMIPLAERLTFVDNQEYKADGDITIEKSSLQKRGFNSLQVIFPEATPRSLSVSVTDASYSTLEDNESIYSRFLLTSDLKGYVYNPAYYFNSNTDSTRQALDNVMLTHGWSRYKWSDLLNNSPISNTISVPYLININGVVNDSKDKSLIKGGFLNLYMEDEDSTVTSFRVPVSGSGRFRLDSLLFNGNARFYYVYTNESDKQRNVVVTIDEDSMHEREVNLKKGIEDIIMQLPDLNKNLHYNQVENLTKKEGSKELDEVVLHSKQKRPSDITNEKYASGFFQNTGKIVSDNINNPPLNQSLSVVNYVEQTVTTIKLQGQRFVNTKNFSLKNGQMWEVGVLLNEVPTTLQEVRPLLMRDIALIKFYEAGFPGVSSNTPGGAIAIYTKENTGKPKDVIAGERYFLFNGYSLVKEFYHPDYSNPASTVVKDFRSTLYWNPAVFTSTEKPGFKFSFYNNDQAKSLKVILEGFDGKGRLTHVEKIIK